MKTYGFMGQELALGDCKSTVDELSGQLSTNQGGYVCVVNVHTITMAVEDAEFNSAIRSAKLCVPDGMPLVLAGRLFGNKCKRISGPDLMHYWLTVRDHTHAHFLLGSTEYNQERIMKKYPVKFVGKFAPEYGPINADVLKQSKDLIKMANANVVWVGLGAPKQELFMERLSKELPNVLLIGVGAAFDFLSGSKSRAPRILQLVALEWLWRLCHEPRRLFVRYLKYNFKFLVYCIGRRKA